MSRILVPRMYQHLMLDFGMEHERCNWFAGMGLGKTGSGVELYDRLRLLGEVQRLLVLAPKRVAESSWPGEVTKWGESFGHLKVAAAIGTPEKRLAALRSTPDILTINYDNIEWLMEQYGDAWPFDMVIADESTRLKGLRISYQRRRKKDGSYGVEFLQGQGASRAKALAGIAHKKVRRWVNLTGSPAPNGLVDLWGQQWFIDRGEGLGNSFDSFKKRWFTQKIGSSREQERLEPKAHALREIRREVKKHSIVVDARDWFDIKAPIVSHQMITLPPAARKQYREMEKEFFTWVGEHPLEVFAAGPKMNKCLQLASGSVLYNHEGDWAPVHKEKLEALRSIVEETNGEPLLVAYQYRADLERILKEFPQASSLQKNSDRTIKAFQAGDIPMLVVHPASAGHGLDLQHNCHIMVDYSSGWNLELDEQVIERIGPTRQAQIGRNIAVFRYRIVAQDTLEETFILPLLEQKAGFQEALKNAMKRQRALA